MSFLIIPLTNKDNKKKRLCWITPKINQSKINRRGKI